jgi:CRISPR-associated endoribonuclease Cas6
MQGFIYGLLEKSSQFSQLHDKKGYKFFCFSNIFSPSGSNDNTDIRYIIISSPNRDFVRYVSMMLIKIKERKDRVSIARYADFTGQEIASENKLPLIQKLTFKKQISTRINLHDTEQIVIGSLWEFSFDDDQNTELLQLGLDCGLGERNSMGFGFMNVKKTP